MFIIHDAPFQIESTYKIDLETFELNFDRSTNSDKLIVITGMIINTYLICTLLNVKYTRKYATIIL